MTESSDGLPSKWSTCQFPLEEHVEITTVQKRFEKQRVARERISACRVEQDADVPAGHVAEVSQGESVDFRKKFFRDAHLQGLSFHELEWLWLQFEVDTVAVGSGVTRMAVTGSQSYETKLPERSFS